MISKINIDMILSDPMLLVGVGLVLFGVLLFLLSLWKLLFARHNKAKFVVPEEGTHEEVFSTAQPEPHLSTPTQQPEIPQEPVATQEVKIPEPEIAPASPKPQPESNAEKTMIMKAEETEIQLQLDIIVSQLKNLNKKINDLEERFDTLPDTTNTPQDVATLREMPTNAEDYAKKLLKLAEHVIMLEKDVARMKESPKPPIMPL